jgi:osmotically-inducible protein OsmY
MKDAFNVAALALASSLVVLAGCDRADTPAEQAAERAEDRADVAEDRADERVDAAEDRADAMEPGLGERTEGAASQAGQAIDDAKITTTVKSKYLADDTLKGLDISVDTEQGVVTLTGKVQNDAAKELANTIATGVDGVVSVNNQLTVGP